MWVGSGIAMFALALGVTLSAMLAEERRQRRRELHLDARAALQVGEDPPSRVGAIGA